MVLSNNKSSTQNASRAPTRKSLLRYPLRTSVYSLNRQSISTGRAVATGLKQSGVHPCNKKTSCTTSTKSLQWNSIQGDINRDNPSRSPGMYAWGDRSTFDSLPTASPQTTPTYDSSLGVDTSGSDNLTTPPIGSPRTSSNPSPGTSLEENYQCTDGCDKDGEASERSDSEEESKEVPRMRSQYPTVEELLDEELEGMGRVPNPERNLMAFYSSTLNYSTRPDLAPVRWKVLLDTKEGLLELLEQVKKVTADDTELFLDEEGNGHGVKGVLCTVQLTFASMAGVTFILDVVKLGQETFTICGEDGISLKTILEDPKIFKCFFDARNDSAALYHQYGVKLQGVVDLQIMELAVRGSCNYCKGLAASIKDYLYLNTEETKIWNDMKNDGANYCGKDYSKWEERPLPTVLLDYAANDTIFMPHLYAYFFNRLQNSVEKMHLVMVETARRIHDSQQTDFHYSGASAPAAFLPYYNYYDSSDDDLY